MEKFKELHEVLQPDVRNEHFQIFDKNFDDFRENELKDIHTQLSDIQLSDGVPENVRDYFITSKHLSLYSWFVYRFIPVAEFHAITSLEFALKEKCKKPKWGLKRLLSYAVQNGWVSDNDFEIHRRMKERTIQRRSTFEKMGVEFNDIEGIDSKEDQYTSILIEAMPYIRNEYAHGSSTIAPQGFLTLTICADFINALYRDK